MEFIKYFLVVGAIFAAIDAFWIGIVANKFYKSQMGSLLRDKPDFVPAVLFYIIYIVGVVVFALNPALDADSLKKAICGGALLGLFAYATYDLTNASTLKGWSSKVTVVDMIWGTFITAASTAVAFLILS